MFAFCSTFSVAFFVNQVIHINHGKKTIDTNKRSSLLDLDMIDREIRVSTTNVVFIFEIRSRFELVWLGTYLYIVNSLGPIQKLFGRPGFVLLVIDWGFVLLHYVTVSSDENFWLFDILLKMNWIWIYEFTNLSYFLNFEQQQRNKRVMKHFNILYFDEIMIVMMTM